MRRDEHERMMVLEVLDDSALSRVTGGADDPSFGRCGPGARWGFLGNVYTPQCAAHDRAVRGGIKTGSSKLMAHVRALPLLPAAIGSYVTKVTGF
jgi:hypothetical protein